MAARLKKLFARREKSRSVYGEQPQATDSDRSFRASLYDSASPAVPPNTGSYPLKGVASFEWSFFDQQLCSGCWRHL